MLRGGCGDLGDTGDTPLCVCVTPRKPRHCLPRGPSTLTPRSPSRTASTSPSRSGPCWLTWRRAWAPSRWVMPLTLCHPWHPQIPYRVPPCTLQLWVPYFAPQCPLLASVGAPLLSLPFDHHWVPPPPILCLFAPTPICYGWLLGTPLTPRGAPHLQWLPPCTPYPLGVPPPSHLGAPHLLGLPWHPHVPLWVPQAPLDAPLAPQCPLWVPPSPPHTPSTFPPLGSPLGSPVSPVGAPLAPLRPPWVSPSSLPVPSAPLGPS